MEELLNFIAEQRKINDNNIQNAIDSKLSKLETYYRGKSVMLSIIHLEILKIKRKQRNEQI